MFPEYIQGHVLNLIQSLRSTPIQNYHVIEWERTVQDKRNMFTAYLFLEKHLRKLNCDEE